MSIEVRHIHYVIAAADHGSFRRAAAILGVRESAISRRIGELEERLGTRFFIRSAGGVQLTQAGRQFVQRGRKVLSEIGLARTEVGSICRGDTGEIRIGIVSSVGAGFLEGLLHDYASANPRVRMTFIEGDHGDHATAVRRHDLDIAFVAGAAQWPGCMTEPLWEEHLFVALPADHELAAMTLLTWQDVGSERFIVGDRPAGQEMHHFLTQRLSYPGHQPQIEHHGVGRFNLLLLVALGRGLSLACEGVAERGFGGVTFRPLADDALAFSALWSSTNENPALQRFLELARAKAAATRHPEFSFLFPKGEKGVSPAPILGSAR